MSAKTFAKTNTMRGIIATGRWSILNAFVTELLLTGFKYEHSGAWLFDKGTKENAIIFSEKTGTFKPLTLTSPAEADFILEDKFGDAVFAAIEAFELFNDDAIKFGDYNARFDLKNQTVSFGYQTFDVGQVAAIRRVLAELTTENLQNIINILNGYKAAPKKQGFQPPLSPAASARYDGPTFSSL